MAQTSTQSTQINDFRWTIYPGEDNEHESMIRNRMDDVQHRLSELEPDDRDWFTTQSESDTKYFIKIFRHDSFLQRSRYTLFGSQAWNEWNHLLKLHDADVPVPEPVALGQRFSSGLLNACVLICRNIDGTTLRDVLENQYGTDNWTSIRSELWQTLAKVTVQLIQEGFYHQDYHDGNLIVSSQIQSGDSWNQRTIYVTDLHRATSSSYSLTSNQIGRMLAFLVYSMETYAPLWECRRFYKSVQKKSRSDQLPDWPDFMRHYFVERRREHRTSRINDCMEQNNRFAVTELHDTSSWTVHHRRSISKDTLHDWLHSSSTEEKADAITVLNHGTNKAPLSNSSDIDSNVIIRSFNEGDFSQAWERFTGRSVSRTTWQNGYALQIRNVKTPESLALIEPKNPFSDRPSYYVQKSIPECKPLQGRLQELHSFPPEKRQQFIASVARYVRYLHRQGIFKLNLDSSNLLVHNNELHHDSFVLMDHERIQFYDQPLPSEPRVTNLVQLASTFPSTVSRTDLIHGWKTYINGPTVPFRNTRETLKNINQQIRKRIRRK